MPVVRTSPGELYITAGDCPARLRGGSYLQCDGVSDEEQIQAAVDALRDSGGRVYLSPGSFRIGSPITLALGSGLAVGG